MPYSPEHWMIVEKRFLLSLEFEQKPFVLRITQEIFRLLHRSEVIMAFA